MLKIVKKKKNDCTYIRFIVEFTEWQDKAATRRSASRLHSADFCSAGESVQQILRKENDGV